MCVINLNIPLDYSTRKSQMFREGFLENNPILSCYFMKYKQGSKGQKVFHYSAIPLFAGTYKDGYRSSSAAWWCSSKSLFLLYPEKHKAWNLSFWNIYSKHKKRFDSHIRPRTLSSIGHMTTGMLHSVWKETYNSTLVLVIRASPSYPSLSHQ